MNSQKKERTKLFSARRVSAILLLALACFVTTVNVAYAEFDTGSLTDMLTDFLPLIFACVMVSAVVGILKGLGKLGR